MKGCEENHSRYLVVHMEKRPIIMLNNYDEPEVAAAAKQIISYLHPLRYLFFELTRECNLRCKHCGSRCPEYIPDNELSASEYKHIVDRVSEVYPVDQVMFCITGGEPLLRQDWFEICSYISSKGFSWGMTTNGTLIDEKCIYKLKSACMKTVSVSIDGLRDNHEKLRDIQGSFDQAVHGIRLLKKSGHFHSVQAVTVVNKLNIHELPELYGLIRDLGVDSWKLTAIEPMGDALSRQEIFLDEHDHYDLLTFIMQLRQKAEIDVTYGCGHFLPKRYDNTVRKHPFLCGAGTMIASIASNGDILPCLDIDCRETVKQGNIRRNDFIDVWENRFELFRKNKANTSAKCRECQFKQECHGDSWHSWDFEKSEPRICFKTHTFF